MKIFKNMSTKSLLLILGIAIGAGISVVWASSTWRGVGKLNTVISENRVVKPNELKDIRDNLEYIHNWVKGHRTYKKIKININGEYKAESFSCGEGFITGIEIYNHNSTIKYIEYTCAFPPGASTHISHSLTL